MSKHLISYDPLNRVSAWYEPDGYGGGKVAHTQDIAPALKRNKQLQRTPELAARGKKADMMHFAHIPAIAMMDIKTKHGIDVLKATGADLVKLERLLQSREYCHLRTVDTI